MKTRLRFLTLLLAVALGCACVGILQLPPVASVGGDGGPGGPDGGDAGLWNVVDAGPVLDCTYVATSPDGAVGPRWQRAGPPGGYASAVLALANGVVIAGTGGTRGLAVVGTKGGGLYRSTDSAANFTSVKFFGDTEVSALAYSAASGKIYAGTGVATISVDDAVFVSADQGQSFALFDGGLPQPARVQALSVAPGTPERVYALVKGSVANPYDIFPTLFRSDNGGAWTARTMTGIDTATGGPALAMAADIADPNRVYLVDAASFYYSTNGGDVFTPVNNPFGGLANVTGIFTDAADMNHLLITTSDSGLFESTNRGLGFLPKGLTTVGSNAAVVSGGRLLVGTEGQGFVVGANGAFNGASACPVLPLVRAVAVAPDNANNIFIGTMGAGVLRSTNGGASFTPQLSGIYEVFGKVAVTPSAAWILSAAGLFRSGDQGTTWARVAPNGTTYPYAHIAEDPQNTRHLLVATDEDLYLGGGSGVGVLSVTLDAGTALATGLSGSCAGSVAFDPTAPGRAFAYQRQSNAEAAAGANISTGVFASANSGASFVQTPLQSASLDISSTFRNEPLAVASDGTVYAGVRLLDGGQPGLLRSADHGVTFTQVWSDPAYVPSGVFVDPANAVYLTGRQLAVGLYKSVNQGMTFTAVDAGLTGASLAVNGLALTGTTGVALATMAGAFYAPDGVAFSDYNTGFSTLPAVWNLAITSGAAPVVLAATDQGIFRRTLGP